MRWMLWVLGFAGAIAALCAPWGGKRARAVNVLGSTSVQPFAEMLSQEFNARNPGQVVDVQGGGSTAGIQAAKEGIADVGMCSRELKADEKLLFNRIEIARDGLAIVVHTSNKVEALKRDHFLRQLAGMEPVAQRLSLYGDSATVIAGCPAAWPAAAQGPCFRLENRLSHNGSEGLTINPAL